MKTLRLALLGLLLSIVALVIILSLFRVDPSEVYRVGGTAFLLSSLTSVLRLSIQGFRFHILATHLSSTYKPSLTESLLVRAGSEFLALTIVPYGGDEMVRLAWLSEKKVETGRAIWISSAELFLDVFIGASVALISASYAAYKGAFGLALLIGGISIIILGVYGGALLYFSRLKEGRVNLSVQVAGMIAKFLGEERAERYVKAAESTLESFCGAVGESLSPRARGVMVKAVLLTVAMILISTIGLWMILSAVGLNYGFLTSLLALQASVIIGIIPVTLGGSGLTEAGMGLYTAAVTGITSWGAVIAWRIASYHIPLAICGAALILILAGRMKR